MAVVTLSFTRERAQYIRPSFDLRSVCSSDISEYTAHVTCHTIIDAR